MLNIVKSHKYKTIIISLLWIFYVKKIDIRFFVRQIMFYFYKSTEKGKLQIKNSKEKAKKIIKNQLTKKKFIYNFNYLPQQDIDASEILNIMYNRKSTINNKISGGIYINDNNCQTLLKELNNNYLFSNPLHPDLFPELIKMESEVVKMVGGLYDIPVDGGGNITTGGTESTILALKAYRNLKQKFIYFGKPEVLCTKTVHAAVNKACELLGLKIVYVDLDKDFIMDITSLKNKISRNTCCIVASAPCFAYGLMDPIKEISFVACDYNIPLHVDACLGGFICQFNEKLKLSFKSNIQSISIDPHKFGYSPKGSSILLWRDKLMKHKQYSIVSEWTGGIYASVSLPGSRSGSQIVTTWGTLLYHGHVCYKNYSDMIIKKTHYLKIEIQKINSFNVIGNPNVNVVAFYSDKYSTSHIVDVLQKNDWNLNILQNPICLHICITPKNIKNINKLVALLNDISKQKVSNKKDDNMTAIYGMAKAIPDKTIINELVEYYLDLTTDI